MNKLGNVGFVCPDHSPKPGGYVGRKPETLIGRFVKLGFPITEEIPGGPKVEHMWVRIDKYNNVTKEFEGTLNNDPMFVTEFACDDGVGFTIEEIEDVYDRD